jgi:hypothetical protein
VTQILSFLLAGVVVFALSGTVHEALGTRLGAAVDLLLYFGVFYFTNRMLRNLRDE